MRQIILLKDLSSLSRTVRKYKKECFTYHVIFLFYLEKGVSLSNTFFIIFIKFCCSLLPRVRKQIERISAETILIRMTL